MDRIEHIRRYRNFQRISRHQLVDASNPMESLPERAFYQRYRFSKNLVADILLELVKDELTSYHGCQIPPLFQLLLGLRFFANGAFQLMVSDSMGVSQPTMHRIIKKVSRAIAVHHTRFIKFPTAEEARRVRSEFYELASFPGEFD